VSSPWSVIVAGWPDPWRTRWAYLAQRLTDRGKSTWRADEQAYHTIYRQALQQWVQLPRTAPGKAEPKPKPKPETETEEN